MLYDCETARINSFSQGNNNNNNVASHVTTTAATASPVSLQHVDLDYIAACTVMSRDWDKFVPRGDRRREFVQHLITKKLESRIDLVHIGVSVNRFEKIKLNKVICCLGK